MKTRALPGIEEIPLLLMRPLPDKAESLAGYLLRLADVNYLHHVHDLLGYLQQKRSSIYQASMTPQFGVYSLSRLSKQLGIEVDALKALARPLSAPIGRYRTFSWQGYEWPLHLIRNRYRVWCPLCLGEQALQRASWEWILATTCPKHKILLVDCCPCCMQRVPWRFSQLRHCVCGFPLDKAPAIAVATPDQVIDIESLTCTELQRFITLSILFSCSSATTLDAKHLEKIPLADLHCAQNYILPTDINEQRNFRRALLGILYRRFRQQFELGPRYTACPLLNRLKIDPSFDDELKMIGNDWLSRQNPHSSIAIIDNKTTSEDLTFPSVATTLNASPHVVSTLVKRGVLNCPPGSRSSSGKSGITRHSLARLQSVLSRITPYKEGWRRIKLDHFGINFSSRLNLLGLALAGGLKVGSYDIRVGLPSLELYLVETPSNECGYLNVADVAKVLDIYQGAIYHVARSGLLPHEIYMTRQLHFTIEDVHEFHHQYVFAREIAQQLGCNATNLADKIISAGIKPIHGPGVDDGLVYLFRRSDVATLDLAKICSQTPYESRAGRGHKRTSSLANADLLTKPQVCKLLSIRPHQLDKVSSAGLLVPYQSREPAICITYRAADVEAYRQDYIQNTNLVSIYEARQMASEKGHRLQLDILGPGLVVAISTGYEMRYRRDELEGAFKLLESTLDVRQLALTTGLSPATIRKEAQEGCLTSLVVFSGNGMRRYLFSKQAVEVLISKKIQSRKKELGDDFIS
nr:TniQ family protein [uncultured Pseudogulbenkiania sp.]